MFRKKRAASNPQPPPQAAPPSAASAAALAFLNKRASDANLSASAAAAALRSHTASPEPVGAIQTKRMMRRGSTSSFGSRNESPTGSLRQPFSSTAVQRSGSSASMRDRTFRSPSPGGRKALTPLPTLHDDVPPIPQKSHRRTPSGELPGRVSSPPAAVARPASAMATTTVRYDPHTRTVVRVPVQNPTQSGNAGSPRSVNFSRPMSPPIPQSSNAREQVRARPATAQGFSSVVSTAAAPPMPTMRQQQKALQSSAARSGPAARPGSSAGVPAGALVAASVAARPASVAASPIASVQPASRSSAARSAVDTLQAKQSPVASQPRSVASSDPSAAAVLPASSKPIRPTVTTGPSEEEIKVFQNRAAAMLARPLSDANATTVGDATSASVHQQTSNGLGSATGQIAPATTAPKAPQLSTAGTNTGRTTSTSPSRSAHFSQSPLMESFKHQPPSRDLSPAKSALKAPSPRAASPAGSPMRAMSETSETQSEDGGATGTKKKKAVRVSFDEQAVLVGEASSPLTPASSIIMSPQYKTSDRESSDASGDQPYTPRPALPSFGSVRERSTSPALPAEHSQPPAAESSSIPTVVTPSSDHAAGSVLAQDFATRSAEQPENAIDKANDDGALSEHVPSIAVLPATPRIDQEDKRLESEPSNVHVEADDEPQVVTENAPAVPPAAEPSPARAILPPESDPEEPVDHFSDAAEEPSEMENEGGFAPLDAIIESPSAETAPQLPFATRSVAPSSTNEALGTAVTTPDNGTTGAAPAEGEDWDRIRKYWSSLSEQRKRELEQEAAKNVATSEFASEFTTMGASENRDVSAVEGVGSTSRSAGTSQPPLPPWPDHQYQQSVKSKPPPMKQTMRAAHQRAGSEPSHMRTSLRDSARPSSAMSEAKAKPTSTQRPKSAVSGIPASSASATALALANATKKAEKPKLERTLSNDSSASESSFRRKRRGSVASSEGGGYSMKRSMRGPPQPTSPTSPSGTSNSRLSMGARSPPGKRPPRTSLRGSVDSTTPSLRSNGFRSGDQRASKQSSSMMGLGKPAKISTKAAKPTSRFKSRFNDSSDEDEDADPRRGFSSRFGDSDDEDDAGNARNSTTKLTPVRGIPKKAGQASADSTDLEDSDNEVQFTPDAAAMALARQKLAAQGAVRPTTPPNASEKKDTTAGTATAGTALKTRTLRADNSSTSLTGSPNQAAKAKRGLFGLGKKKQGAVGASNTNVASSPLGSTASPTAANVVTKTETRTTEQWQTTNATVQSTTETSPKTGRSRFFRRLSYSGAASTDAITDATTTKEDEGPPALPAIPPIPPIPDSYKQDSTVELDRPNTSDGASTPKMPTTLRPALGEKRDSAMTAPLESRPVIVSERTGKKKKFQGLRRFLGVHD